MYILSFCALLLAFMNITVQASSYGENVDLTDLKPRVLIVGAGLGGLSTAIGLKNVGIVADIIEKRSSFKAEGAGIALPANAVWALEQLGLGKELEGNSRIIPAMEFTKDTNERLSFQEISHIHNSGLPFRAIHRRKLHEILMDKIDLQTIRYGTTMSKFEETEKGVKVCLNTGKESVYDLVIGADGIYSTTRTQLYHKDHSESLDDLPMRTWRAVIGPLEGLDHPIYMLGMNTVFLLYPINDNQTYIYAQVIDENFSKDQIEGRLERFKNLFKSYGGYVPKALEQINNPNQLIPGFLKSVKKVQWGEGSILLLGDAAHGCSPSLQQGGALTFEDAYVLQDEIKKKKMQSSDLSFKEILENFKQRRQDRVQKIIDMSSNGIKFIGQEELVQRYKFIQEQGAPNILAFKTFMNSNP